MISEGDRKNIIDLRVTWKEDCKELAENVRKNKQLELFQEKEGVFQEKEGE